VLLPAARGDSVFSRGLIGICNDMATAAGDPAGMRPWVGNLIGLVLGFTIAGEALFIWYSRVWAPTPPPPPVVAVPVQRRAPQIADAEPAPAPLPVELPRFVPPSPSAPPDALPTVVYPDTPPPGSHKPGSAMAGTGFFVTSDGLLLTAAHVVTDCKAMRIASKFVQPRNVRLLATDIKRDVALLQAEHVMPPATLPIGRPAAAGGRLFVLGYPANGGPLVPTETWGTLENANLEPAPADSIDPRRLIWAAAPEVAHGFSGGPMLDPRNGAVVGIVRGMVDSARLHAERAAIPPHGMVIGPGSSTLAALLDQQGADDDAIAMSGDEALDAARRATVHVLCLY
jgi:S1-C subfamily serine protease